MSNDHDPFLSIETEQLTNVSGGAARVAAAGTSSSTNDQLTQMLTSIGESIRDLARNNNGGQDQMTQMMMMMMMMGGFGGGGAAAAPAAPPAPTYVQVTSRGKKGW